MFWYSSSFSACSLSLTERSRKKLEKFGKATSSLSKYMPCRSQRNTLDVCSSVGFRKAEECGWTYQRKVGVRRTQLEVGELVDVSLCLQMEVLFYLRLHFWRITKQTCVVDFTPKPKYNSKRSPKQRRVSPACKLGSDTRLFPYHHLALLCKSWFVQPLCNCLGEISS